MTAAAVAFMAGMATVSWVKGCGVCKRAYEVDGWKALPAVATLPTSTVQAHLTVPVAFSVELRRCFCGAVLAVRSR